LTEVLKLESKQDFDKMEFGLLAKGIRKAEFTKQQLSDVLVSLEKGEADWLQLSPTVTKKDWVIAYHDRIHLSWHSSITKLARPPSPIDLRFGDAGSIVVTYPLNRFQVESQSSFQVRLVQLMKKLTREQDLYWSFIHEGFRPKRPASVGEDDVFQETREKFPLTSFDSDLHVARFFKEFVKGAFWANSLNPTHVERLGGSIENRSSSPVVYYRKDERRPSSSSDWDLTPSKRLRKGSSRLPDSPILSEANSA